MSSNTGKKLEVVEIDLLSDRNGVNKMGHNTSKYEYDELIVRRGQSFKIKVTFSRRFDQNSEIIVLEMNGNGKRYIIIEQSNVDDATWGFVVKKQNGDIVTLNVCTSADCPVGRFRFFVWTLSKTYSNVTLSQYNPKNDIYVLFNPWLQADVVYMSGDEEKKEYVLNDGGCIFYGSQNQIFSRPWNYGQFEKPILDATLLLLQSTENRGDAINVVRSISALVNANDESGVLVGNWGATFPDGISPMAWNGSVEILRKFYKTRNSVKYGQCWVFAGVVTTVLRSLGIPCRTISNFSSAHDTDKNVTIDIFMDESFNVLNSLSSDSIWNFHCWNEGWLERSDLGSKYGGWQVIDSTPQERSSGLFQCGPTSVAAIKNGEIYHDYDGYFVFAEVNSDQVYWEKKTDGSVRKIYTDMTVVGKNISTKVMGSSSAREDITLQYKFPEGSEEERVVVQKATRIANPDRWFSSGRSDEFSFPVAASSRMSNISNVEVMYNPDRSADISHPLARRNDDPTIMSPMTTSIGPVAMFDSSRLSHFGRHGIMANRAISAMSETPDQSTQLIIETNENTTVGKPLNAKVRVINDSSAIRTIKLKILGHVVTYTGNVVGKFYEKDVELKLQASQEQDVQIMVQPEEYVDLLVDNFSFRFTARAHTVETKSVAASIRTYRISSPELNITVPVNIKVHQKFQVEVGFTNPISRPLEGVILKAEGSGLETPETTKASIIGPNATVKLIIPDVEATRTGQLSLIISLDDPKLPEVHGQVKFEVQD